MFALQSEIAQTIARQLQAVVSPAEHAAMTETPTRDEAIRSLQTTVGKPYGRAYGDLRLNPLWDPLRGDARFEAMVASLAPKP